MNLVPCNFQPNLSPVGTAVLLNVTQALLKNAKKTQRRIFRNTSRNTVVCKVDMYFLLICKLLAEGFRPRNQSQIFERGGM